VDEFRLKDLRFGRRAGFVCAALAVAWSLGLFVWDLTTSGGVSGWLASTPLALSIIVWLLLWHRTGWLGHLRWLVASIACLGFSLVGFATLLWGGWLILPVASLMGVTCLFMCPIRDGIGREPISSDLVGH
jgi:hypothetical protein